MDDPKIAIAASKITAKVINGVIPWGDYCYETLYKVVTINNRIYTGKDTDSILSSPYTMPTYKVCPFWHRIDEDNVYCSIADTHSGWGDLTLLWDQIKCCNYKLDNSKLKSWDNVELSKDELLGIIDALTQKIASCTPSDDPWEHNTHIVGDITYKLSDAMVRDIID